MEVEMTDMLDDPNVQAIVMNSREIAGRKLQGAHDDGQWDRNQR
jgi:hypothetical protein